MTQHTERCCPQCQSTSVLLLKRRGAWLCGACEHMFSASSPQPDAISFLSYSRPKLKIFLSCMPQMDTTTTKRLPWHSKTSVCLNASPHRLITSWETVQARGHDVWVDHEQLSPGCDWETDISNGLNRVKEAQEHGRVLLLMTPHALRRPDGYCLNEIARGELPPVEPKSHAVRHVAITLRLSIFPVFVATCEPPQSISHLPYFDMRSVVPLRDLSESSDAWNTRLRTAMSTPALNARLDQCTGLLEMCDNMLAYAVPAIAGVDNLGLCLPQGPPSAPLQLAKPETASTQRFVFSYGEKCADLARQLYNDMTDAGLAVHPMSLRPLTALMSAEDEDARRQALDWAQADNSGKLVLFITPGSVGRPHGVCLNEISLAISKGLGFVPLMVRPCEIPLSICRIQWLDMCDVCAVHRQDAEAVWGLHPARYAKRYAQLLSALNGQMGLDHDGQQARLFSLLSPFSFQSQVSKLTQLFVGREWVLAKYDAWVQQQHGSRVFVVSGVIGSGKSAVAAQIIQNRPEIAAFHLASLEEDQTQSGRRCILSLVYQLTTQLPEYANVLKYVHGGGHPTIDLLSSREPLEEIVPVKSVVDLLHLLLIAPLNAITHPSSMLVILLDGIECFEAGFIATLTAHIDLWPSWVRFVFGTREDPAVLQTLQAYMPPAVSLDPGLWESKMDIKAYLGRALDPHFPSEAKRDETVDFIAARAEGLFLYARHLVNAIAVGQLQLTQLDAFPTSMGGCLQHCFDSQFPSIEYYKKTIRPVLEVLCAANEPLPLSMLRSILQLDVYQQQDILLWFGSLFYMADGDIIKPFHSSVFDWLKDMKSAGSYFVDVENGHYTIGTWCYNEYMRSVKAGVDFSKLDYDLETDKDTSTRRARIYIVRHALQHLEQLAEESHFLATMEMSVFFNSDKTFLLAQRLLSIREIGLQSFFHGKISRDEAQALLQRNAQPGAFLIRYSSAQKAYCVSFLPPTVSFPLTFYHNLIYHLNSGAYSLVPPHEVTAATEIFSDLVSFVEAFQRRGILQAPIRSFGTINRSISKSM
ncbi:hypothetical protein ACHHYP_00765 [Achlya hypogyna]|uniref:SH2 domain-containing protein n=1 Tax=Achlya hypogyna TaxID=1202772 RepID=A0A1V9ZTZ7_ACHHY|nr:hypothetical protein ACHHYP_00765 [Achlya hypogyna]